MRIQHNIAALNSYRQLGSNNNSVSKNLEKLSSGFRINRAGDDASGLAVSEKMRAQITGLETAQKNAQDGISLVQTAEGNLTEVHSMLNRMVELATQSANGTYKNEVDRENIQKEVDSLRSEINRIADSANYNGIKLLDGSLGGTSKSGELIGAAIAKYKGGVTNAITGTDASTAPIAGKKATYEMDLTGLTFTAGQTLIYNGVTLTEGTTTGLAAANTDAQNAAAIADAWKKDAKFGNYDIVANGSKITITAKNVGVDAAAATLKTTMTGTSTTTGSKAVTESVVGRATAGIDYFQKDTVNVDGSEISIDWSKLSEDDRKLLQKNWTDATGAVTADDAKKAADIIQNTINNAITEHNSKNGTNINTIKVEASGASNAAKSFTFASGQKDGDSKLSFTGGTNTVLGQTVGTAAITTNAPNISLNINPADIAGKFTMKLGDQEVEVDMSTSGLTGTSSAADLENALNASITKALQNYDTSHGLSGDKAMAGKLQVEIDASGSLKFTNTTGDKISFSDKDGGEVAKTLGISAEGKITSSGGLVLQVGDTSESYQQVTVNVGSMSAESLGIAGLNVKNQEGAKAAIDKIKTAINTVSSTRGDLGAIQNRLDHTINNLGVTSENMTAAESRIRDVDMAKEMMDFTKNNILSQAAQAMLAQANQIPQGVLQLLQ